MVLGAAAAGSYLHNSCDANTLLGEAHRRLRVGDGCNDLAAMADDPASPSNRRCRRHRNERLRGVKMRTPAEGFAFPQIVSQEAGLKTFETELLEHPVVVAYR